MKKDNNIKEIQKVISCYHNFSSLKFSLLTSLSVLNNLVGYFFHDYLDVQMKTNPTDNFEKYVLILR